MGRFLSILRFSAILSGVLAELVPALLVEFRKRDNKELIVTSVTNVNPSKPSSGEWTQNGPPPQVR